MKFFLFLNHITLFHQVSYFQSFWKNENSKEMKNNYENYSRKWTLSLNQHHLTWSLHVQYFVFAWAVFSAASLLYVCFRWSSKTSLATPNKQRNCVHSYQRLWKAMWSWCKCSGKCLWHSEIMSSCIAYNMLWPLIWTTFWGASSRWPQHVKQML